jgi:regulator of sigma E protease
MEFLSSLSNISSILLTALGLGLVIFIHELGHFAVAKWCDVKVERFSIGFGPLLLKFVKGETEYALSLLPLGGYVKMLGQDDGDPSQMTSDQIARDPRSYPAKSVPQRMAIISAGVIMNLISAVLFFILSFLLAVHENPAVIGNVIPGMAAWQGGLRPGDKVVRIGHRSGNKLDFTALQREVALSSEGQQIQIEVERAGQRIKTFVEPQRNTQNPDELFPTIYTDAELSLNLARMADPNQRPVVPGLAAERAEPPFLSGDQLVSVEGIPLESFTQFQQLLARHRAESIQIGVRRSDVAADGPVTEISVGPNPFRLLGLRMAIGKIHSIQRGSPADQGSGENRLREGDTIVAVAAGAETLQVGRDIDPLRLPDFCAQHAGEEVIFTARREVNGGQPTTLEVKLTPEAREEWIERPLDAIPNCPLAISSVGVAYHVLHRVVFVEEGSLAASLGIREGDNILSLKILPSTREDGTKFPPIEEKVSLGDDRLNWPGAFLLMQNYPGQDVELEVKSADGSAARKVTLTPVLSTDWFFPMRGLRPTPRRVLTRADSLGEAVGMGLDQMYSELTGMYLTIPRLLSGRISHKAMGGPIAIAGTTFHFAREGYGDLLRILAMISVSLAVLNFLPIPVLDGGHFVFLLWEWIRGKPPNERVVITATWIGLAMILSLMVFVLFRDVTRLVG